jgi:hypothetical protein
MSQTQAKGTLHEWSQSAPYWEKHAQTIRAIYAPLTRGLMEEAGIERGQSVLDGAGGKSRGRLACLERISFGFSCRGRPASGYPGPCPDRAKHDDVVVP